MREIKFRAWVPSKKILCDVLTFDFNEKTAQLPIETEVNAPYWWDVTSWSFKDIKLLQYTGLKDKNGIEIYEGDIVLTNNPDYDKEPTLNKVEFVEDGYRLVAYNLYYVSTPISRYYSTQVEVVGNIYEHPHLLEVTE